MKYYRMMQKLVIPGLIFLAACGALPAQETPTPEVETSSEDFSPIVSATGAVVPAQWATLSLTTAGNIKAVLIQEDQVVGVDQALVRLEGGQQLQAGVTQAKFELASSEAALNELYDNTELTAAQALQDLEDAEHALEDLLDFELQKSLALQAIADAKKAVDSAERRVRILQSTAGTPDINAAKAQVVLAEDVLKKAEKDFAPYAGKREDSVVRANYLARLSAAQKAYDAAVRNLNAMLSTGNEVELAVAEAELATAQAQFSQAEREWQRVQQGPSQAEVAMLEARIQVAKRDYQTYQNGPDADDLAVAEARLENAKEQLAAATSALSDLELLAPFDGTASKIFVHVGEWVSPGQPVLLLADLGHLRVETTDLNEIDAAQIEKGAKAIVTFDALPGIEVDGVVTHIATKASEGTGVNYTVTVELDEIPEQLRWGMTAFVDIQIEG